MFPAINIINDEKVFVKINYSELTNEELDEIYEKIGHELQDRFNKFIEIQNS